MTNLIGQQARVTLLSLTSLAMGLQADMGILDFLWLLEIQTQVVMLTQQALLPTETFPQPHKTSTGKTFI